MQFWKAATRGQAVAFRLAASGSCGASLDGPCCCAGGCPTGGAVAVRGPAAVRFWVVPADECGCRFGACCAARWGIPVLVCLAHHKFPFQTSRKVFQRVVSISVLTRHLDKHYGLACTVGVWLHCAVCVVGHNKRRSNKFVFCLCMFK